MVRLSRQVELFHDGGRCHERVKVRHNNKMCDISIDSNSSMRGRYHIETSPLIINGLVSI